MDKNLDRIKGELRSTLSDDIGDALNEITGMLSRNSSHNDDVLHVKSRYNNLRSSEFKNIIPKDEANIERNRIFKFLLHIVNSLEKDDLVVFSSEVGENRITYENKIHSESMDRYHRLKQFLEGCNASFDCTTIDDKKVKIDEDLFIMGTDQRIYDSKVAVIGSYIKMKFTREAIREMIRDNGINRESFMYKEKDIHEYKFNILDMDLDKIVIEETERGGTFYMSIGCKHELNNVFYTVFTELKRRTIDLERTKWMVLGTENEPKEEKRNVAWLECKNYPFSIELKDKLVDFQKVCLKMI